jgi:hypothetical protein
MFSVFIVMIKNLIHGLTFIPIGYGLEFIAIHFGLLRTAIIPGWE